MSNKKTKFSASLWAEGLEREVMIPTHEYTYTQDDHIKMLMGPSISLKPYKRKTTHNTFSTSDVITAKIVASLTRLYPDYTWKAETVDINRDVVRVSVSYKIKETASLFPSKDFLHHTCLVGIADTLLYKLEKDVPNTILQEKKEYRLEDLIED